MISARILLGEIVSAHGIKGEVVIRSYAAEPTAIMSYGPLRDETGQRKIEVVTARPGPKGLIARIADVGDRTAAEALRGTRLYVDRSRLPPAEEDSYYIADLVGLRVHDTSGNEIGRVAAVHNFGAGDLLELTLAGRKTTELVPFTAAYVPAVDVQAGIVSVDMPVVRDDDDGERDAEGKGEDQTKRDK